MEQTSPKSKKRKPGRIIRRILLILLLLIVLAAAALIAYSKLKQEYTVVYTPYTAQNGTISNSLSFSGSLQPIHNTSYTADKDSTVRAVYVSEGEKVKEGQRLMRLQNGQIVEADFDGTVNQIYFLPDDDVLAGDTLVQLVDMEHLKVSVRVDEYDIGDVHVGDRCTVTTTATERTFESVIDSINYVSASTGNVAYYTTLAYVDVDGGVYPGMQVTMTVPMEEAADVVILKLDALSFDVTNRAFVYVMNAEGEMEQKPVTTGVSNGSYVEIKEGVQEGDTVYAVAKEQTLNAAQAMFSSMFGGSRVMPQGGFGGMGGGNNRNGNFGGMGGGNNRNENTNNGGGRK